MSALRHHDDLFRYGPESQAEPVARGIKQVLLGADDCVMQAKTWYARGAVTEPKANASTLVCYVLDGFFEIHIDGKTQILGPSGSFIVPAGTMYEMTCLEEGVLLGVFAAQNESAFVPEALR
ncbi:MAG: hypothetical protein AAFO74_12370 [Pseudomonadota bacterium]